MAGRVAGRLGGRALLLPTIASQVVSTLAGSSIDENGKNAKNRPKVKINSGKMPNWKMPKSQIQSI